jgi:hypothetical protein
MNKLKLKCNYCDKNINNYYINNHQKSIKCLRIQTYLKQKSKILRDIFENNIDEYENNKCMLCKKKILKKAQAQNDEYNFNYSKLHKKCLEKELARFNEKYIVKVFTNPSIDL